MNLFIPDYLRRMRNISITISELIDFEERVSKEYNDGKIRSAIHLSRGNEEDLIEIFQYIQRNDWVFSTWRNHYHALLHGMPKEELFKNILEGRSMSISWDNFYSSSIVGGIIPIAVGVALALKMKKSSRKVWCFIGDMTYETGIFYEAYKYSRNFKLPLEFVVEDNGMSVHTPTDVTWGKKTPVPNDMIYYKYKLGWPHHGTGQFVEFAPDGNF